MEFCSRPSLTSDGAFSYNYDAESRLTSAIATGNNTSYAYDAQGRRKTRTVNGATTVIVTDADNRAVLEYSGSSGALLRWYAHGAGSNDILSQITLGGSRATMIPDIQGSVLATLDSGTGVFTRQNYLPYGKSASASIAGTFGYTGQRIDSESGLYYYRARMYHAGWGRFLQPDPLGTITDDLQPGNNGTGNRGNLYAYVGNDPLNNVDPLGLWTLQLGVTLSGGFGPLAGSFNLGLVADTNGNFGWYSSLAGSVGAGGYIKAGGTGAVSSADTIYDLASNNASGLNLAGIPKNLSQVSNFTAGAGLGGSVDLSVGRGTNGSEYGSWGGTVGAVAGVGATTGYQYTYVGSIYQATPWPTGK